MFSALKKLVGSDQAPVRDKNIPAGLQSMNQALQRRFAKGVQYNSEWESGSGGRGGHGRPRAAGGAHRAGPPAAPQLAQGPRWHRGCVCFPRAWWCFCRESPKAKFAIKAWSWQSVGGVRDGKLSSFCAGLGNL